MTQQTRTKARKYSLLTACLLVSAVTLFSGKAFAACGTPSGIAGDIIYNSTYNVLQYCNGTNWINAGSPGATVGTMTAGDFCTTNGTVINCTSGFTGTGNVVLSAAPTLTGTVAGASSTWSNQVAIGTSTLSGALNVSGTAAATLFSGSGASLTNLNASNISSGTVPTANLGSGIANTVTYLRGDSTWQPIVGLLSGGTANYVPLWTGATSVGTSNIYQSGSNVGFGTTSPTATLTVNGTSAFMYGSDYTTTGNQSDVAINGSSSIRYNGAGTAAFYGIVAGVSGQIIYVNNASSYALTISNQSASEATAGNRIVTGTGADLTMQAGSSAILQYDSVAARWRVMGGSGGGVPAGANQQVQFNSGSNTFAANSNFSYSTANGELVVGTGAATPATTTGTVASVYYNVIPQSMSFGSLGSTSGTVNVSPSTAGQMAYYSAANTISGTTNIYMSGSNIGIGSTSPAYKLDVNGQINGGGTAGVWTANRTGGVILNVTSPTSSTWVSVPGLSLTFTLPRAATIIMTVNGEIRAASNIAHVGMRFVVDGTGGGDATWGTHIHMADNTAGNNWWSTFTDVENTTLTAGTHTIYSQVQPYVAGGTSGQGAVCSEYAGTLNGYTNCTLTIQAFYQ